MCEPGTTPPHDPQKIIRGRRVPVLGAITAVKGEEHVCFHPDCRIHHFGDATSLCWLSLPANEYVLSIPNAR